MLKKFWNLEKRGNKYKILNGQIKINNKHHPCFSSHLRYALISWANYSQAGDIFWAKKELLDCLLLFHYEPHERKQLFQNC